MSSLPINNINTTQNVFKKPFGFNDTDNFSMKPNNKTNMVLKNPNAGPGNMNEVKTPETPNNNIQNFGNPDFNQLELETSRNKPDLVERHNRGLKIIAGYIKDAIIINKTTTYCECADMISHMFSIETNRYHKITGDLKTPTMLATERQNTKRRVYDA